MKPERTSSEEFIKKVNELLPFYITREEAYNAAEREHMVFFGCTRYSSYQSYVNTQSYMHRIGRIKKVKITDNGRPKKI